VVEVTLDGAPDPVTGMVYDLKLLKQVLHQEVVEPMDHRFLNHEVPPFDHVVPTTEHLAAEIWRRLEPHFISGPARLQQVRVYENEDLYVDYLGDAT
jgi:6-pyruvoyltetrahydropterin/6-carboxytetrahydropterin synthase